ncbi:MFS transporter [Silvibacterium dinghuense]|uniref:MFS transporter n=1 Tax=Silvibacterium dinghuense TaxID=1560006 RepID=A0A4Q1SH74_9BACT|nr:MFS transporter [Silvibacterium dinghuense]RXS96894.1 MFS transporter [Silvibacterium dinghuense]GGG94488.1 MFS transporter [Silvibacterium dinghuense]
MTRFSHAWRALRHRNFQLFFFGQGISLIGTWITRIAATWLVYRLTHSALLLGIVGFCGQITSFLLGPLAGAWVERMPRRKLLLWTQAAAAVQSLSLAALTLSHRINLIEIIALSALQGVINAFDAPGRHSFLIQMVDDREDLGNAIALNSALANGARFIGPAFAGVLIAAVGEGWCFLIDGASYIAVIASLAMMQLRPMETHRARAGMLAQLREGWDFVRSSLPIRSVLLLFCVLSLMGYSFTVLLPIFAAQVLHGDARTLGWLSSASGAGALASAISLTLRKGIHGLPRALQIATTVLAGGLIALGFSHALWLSMALLTCVGFGMMQGATITNTIVQSLVPEDKRARVLSYYATAFFGAAPFGNLFAGALAHRIGAPHTVILCGACCLAAALWYTARLPQIQASLPAPAGDAHGSLSVSTSTAR